MRLRDMQILSAGYLLFTLLPLPGISLCLFYNTTGHPCPGCGMTRALHHLLTGDVLAAVRYHSVSLALLPVLLFFISTIFLPPAARLYNENRNRFNLGIMAGAVVVVLYGILRWIVAEGVIPSLQPFFAEFSEPPIIKSLLQTFFH